MEDIGKNNYKWNYCYDKKTPQTIIYNLELVRQKINEIVRKLNEIEISKDKEIERLNNIINELEKWAKSIQLTVYRSDDMPVYQHQDVLDKLKELKEGNKDE